MKKRKNREDNSVRVLQKEKLNSSLNIKPFPWTDKQKKFLDIALDKNTKVILCKGPAGTAKSLLAVYVSLVLLSEKRVGEIIYVRNAVESSAHALGYMPGSLEEKIAPYLQPMLDKLQELLPPSEVKGLLNDKRVRTIPVGFLRGLSINAASIISDESQNLSLHDLLLVMSRLGKYAKLFLIGDIQQSDIRNSAFDTVYKAFDESEARQKGIVTFEFEKSDIMRNEILSFIIDRFEKLNQQSVSPKH